MAFETSTLNNDDVTRLSVYRYIKILVTLIASYFSLHARQKYGCRCFPNPCNVSEMVFLVLVLLVGPAFAATSAKERPVPPPGIEVSAGDRALLESGLKELSARIALLGSSRLVPDVRIYHEAVRYALQYGEFFKPEEIGKARELLQEGIKRAASLQDGSAAWASATGLVARGYLSGIDKSIQPYGLVIPPTYSPSQPKRWRLDIWLHGRNETLSEVNFLWDREHNPGEFTPPNTFVLHLYGRYCNANKFAGEVDLFEALEAVKQQYPIDENRIVIRGFSMGGASAWQFATHYAGDWAAAAPGAGFAETPEFLRVWAKETVKPTWWEQKLWHLYNATDYAVNLYNCPTVAYSGEIDPQQQAAKMMAAALSEEGMNLRHIIGPNTAHKYHPNSKVEINRAIDAIAERGRDPYPRKIRFTTWTLAYNRMKWVTIDGIEKHWERSRLDAEVTDSHTIQVLSSKVTAFSLRLEPGAHLLDVATKPAVVIDGQEVQAPAPLTDGSWQAHFQKVNGQWGLANTEAPVLRKRHGLQGPIDDAFLDSFVFVRPTGTPLVPSAQEWVKSEEQRAAVEWRRQFRGEAQVRDDKDITDEDIANNNLILWGDPGSNQILRRIADKLQIHWTADTITVGTRKFPSANHALVLIYPNPLNPKRYVVLNSGFTYREYDYLNNARQVPKLPDYAVIDITTPPDSRYPGKIIDAGFFGERWELQ